MITQQFTPPALTDTPTVDSRATRDQRLTTALEQYSAAIESGHPLSKDELLAKFSDVAEELSACLDSLDFIRQVAPQISSQPLGHKESPANSIHPLATLGDFRILREIGRGGMGVVYETEQLSLGRRVALKVLPFAGMLDRQQLARFKNEARAAATLDHPNIVAIHSVGCERGVHYYAMHLVEGQSLAEVIVAQRRQHLPLPPGEGRDKGALPSEIPSPKSSAPSPSADTAPIAHAPTLPAPSSSLPAYSSRDYFRTIAQLGIQAAEALDHAHQNGILHRDVKPANLLVDDAGKLWITDFGLARIEQDAGMTMTGDLLGTLRYMSPEQALAKRVVVDHRSDIYSLGVTLYELLTLRPAFPAEDRQELLRQIAFDEPRNLCQINARIPQDLETIVLKAIEKNPAQRYATAAELAADLRRYLDHEPIKAKPLGWRGRATKWARRHPTGVRATIIATSLTFFFIASAIGWALRDRQAHRALSVASTNFAINGMGHYRVGDYDKAIAASREAIKLRPELVEAHYTLGKALMDNGDLDEAEAAFREVVRLKPDDPRAHLDLGWVLNAQGRVKEAAECMRVVVRLRPNWSEVHHNLGVYLTNIDQAESIAEYRLAVKADPSSYSNHYALAVALHDADPKSDEVIQHLRESVRLNPVYSTGYFRLGVIYFGRGDLDNAVSCLSQHVRVDPNGAIYKAVEGVVTRRDGFDGLVNFYRETLRIHTENPVLLLRLSGALRRQRSIDEADRIEAEAVRLVDNGRGNARQLGNYYAEMGDYKKATQWYRRLQRKQPFDSGVSIRLAYLLFMSGDQDGYREQCRYMLERFGDNQDPDVMRRVCWGLCISNPSEGDRKKIRHLAEAAVAGSPAALLVQRERGRAAYRLRDWEAAVQWCAQSRNNADGLLAYAAQNRLIEAMALHQVEKFSEARTAYEEALVWFDQAFPKNPVEYQSRSEWIDYVDALTLRREAQRLLDPSSDTSKAVKAGESAEEISEIDN